MAAAGLSAFIPPDYTSFGSDFEVLEMQRSGYRVSPRSLE